MVLYKVTNLDYEIDGRMLFSDISFEIKAASIHEIRGANGSGKSTLLKIIAGLIPSNSRSFSEEFGSSVSYLGHKNGFVEEITLRENFNILGLGIDKKLFEEFGLNKFKNQKFFNLSYGEKRKAALLRVIAANTKTWILDEPFAGLDTESVEAIKNIFDKHVKNQGCIILANHQESLTTSNKILLEKNV